MRNRRKRAKNAECTSWGAAVQAGGQTPPASGGQTPPAGYDETYQPRTRRQRKEAENARVMGILEDILPPPDMEQEAGVAEPRQPHVPVVVPPPTPTEVPQPRQPHVPVVVPPTPSPRPVCRPTGWDTGAGRW